MICRRYMRRYPGEIRDIIRSLIPDTYTEEHIRIFEEQFASYIGRKYAITVSSGRHGLMLLLGTFGIGPGDEVIFPAYTLKDLILLVREAGIIPVVVDIDEKSYNINTSLIENAITSRTKAIIATHLFGVPCEIKDIIHIAQKHNLIVIEDCAHSLGSQVDGAQTGSFGDAAFFSFELTKPINTFGGGVIVTDNTDLAEQIKRKNMGLSFSYAKLYKRIFLAFLEHSIEKTILFNVLALLFYFPFTTKILSRIYRFLQSKGRLSNIRFSPLQAFLGLQQLKRLDEANKLRIARAQLLNTNLNFAVKAQKVKRGLLANFYFFVICFNSPISSSRLRKFFFKRKVDVGIQGEIADNCTELASYNQPMSVAAKIYSQAILLPLNEGLTENAVRSIAETCNRINTITVKEISL